MKIWIKNWIDQKTVISRVNCLSLPALKIIIKKNKIRLFADLCMGLNESFINLKYLSADVEESKLSSGKYWLRISDY